MQEVHDILENFLRVKFLGAHLTHHDNLTIVLLEQVVEQVVADARQSVLIRHDHTLDTPRKDIVQQSEQSLPLLEADAAGDI